MRLDISKQQAVVDKYKKSAVDTQITAKVSGTVSAVNVTAGKDTVAGDAMAVIDVVDQGYTIKISVTNDQAKQVKVGDTAEIVNNYYGSDITATLEAITADSSKPGQGKLLVFRVTGDLDPGSSITLSIGQKSANYDSIIPKSALREDTNGSFVYVVVAKSSPLGNRYIATRADVQILAQDDNNAAVSGLSSGDYVITTSSKPLNAGDQVRMVESAS
jgi:multidrug efflux pump subunit AcrA (membrane-fusion protein)